MSGILIKDGYVLFWSGWPSNWHPSPFTIDGTLYNCVEQYMMAEKARCFGDTRAEKLIMSAIDPADQKRYGRGAGPYNETKWASVRYDIVLRGTLEKYRQNRDLRKNLLATDDLIFVEASPDDRIWGIGMDKRDPRATDPTKWLGTNLLGKAITEARDIIQRDIALHAG